MLVRLVKCTLLILFLYLAFVAIIQYIPRSIPKNEWRKAPMPYPSDTMNNLFWFVQVSVFNKNVIFMKIVAGNFNCALTVVNAFMNCTMFF